MKGNPVGILLLLAAATLSADEPPAKDRPLPGVLRRQDRTFLVSNHSTACLVWHSLGIRGATLVHLDTHDDCRYVPPDKLQALSGLFAKRDYDTAFLQSDLSSSFSFKVKPDQMLFDLGNFIYPCILDGTVSNFWWIVPNTTLDSASRNLLKGHLQRVLRLPIPLTTTDDTNRFSFLLDRATVTVATLDALPTLPSGALLDVDTDFFTFPAALSEDHLRGKRIWDPAGVCTTLSQRVPVPSVVTVAASVWGGYTPLMYRFISDACFDYASTGRYPPYATQLLRCMEALPGGTNSVSIPSAPDTPTFEAAFDHLNALICLAQGDADKALPLLLKAADATPNYSKGLLDAAEALTLQGKFKAAHAAIDRFDKTVGRPSVPSLAARVLVHLEEGQSKRAESLALRLVAWERTPFALLLYAGALTQQKRYDEALAIYQEVIRSSPNSSAAYYNMGVLQERKGNPDQAIELYNAALAIRPNFDRVLEHLGYLLSTKGKTDEAIETLLKAVEANPPSVTTLNNLGLALCRQGHISEGIQCYQKALVLNSGTAEVHANIASALAVAGRTDEAVAHYREALRLKPGWEKAAAALDQLLKQPRKP